MEIRRRTRGVEESVTPVSKNWKSENPGKYQPVLLSSVLEKVMKCLILEALSAHLDDKKVIRSGQHGLTNSDSVIKHLPECMSAVDIVYLDFSKAFDAVSNNILVSKLRNCGLDEWTVRQIENWLNGRSQSVTGCS
ncbi:RNA-directed DNA polymerase from mobile element jockey-like protein [Turdus rufiventris]|nr:RNA-directed DNA polymerase from mobile element jockey-like protein [Turdus rufiventris]